VEHAALIDHGFDVRMRGELACDSCHIFSNTG